MTDVIVYNLGGHEKLTRVSVKHAIKMIYNNKAVIKESHPTLQFGPYPWPISVELVKYIYAKWKYREGTPPFSKKGVLRRDKERCAYCGDRADTLDHVNPKSGGHQATWLNSVSACFHCNQKKRNRTPKEAGMKLLFEPYVPTYAQIARVIK